MPQYRVKNSVRVRTSPSQNSSNILSESGLPEGTLVEVLETRKVAGVTYGRYEIQNRGGSVFGTAWSAMYRDRDGYQWLVSTDVPVVVAPPVVITPPVVVTPPVSPSSDIRLTARRLLGVSVLEDAALGDELLRQGAGAVLYLNNPNRAIDQAKNYRDAIIIARVWFNGKIDAQSIINALEPNRTDVPRNCITTVWNECDSGYCYGSVEQIYERFNLESAVARAIWRIHPDRIFAIGGFSHGTPDSTSPAILRALDDTYGKFARENRGRLRINWHLYTYGKRFEHHPPADAPIIDRVWYENRDHDISQKLNWGDAVAHITDEHGVEAGNQRGFSAVGYTKEQFREWCVDHMRNRRSLSTIHECMTLFQAGNHPNWQTHNISNYIDVLIDLWRNNA